MRGQLELQHALVTLLQLDAGEGALHIGADGARVRIGFSVHQTEDDGVAITKPGRWKTEDGKKQLIRILYVLLHQYSLLEFDSVQL